MTDKPDPVLQLLSASADILTMFNENLILYRYYKEPLRILAEAIDGVTETYLGHPVINGDEHDLRFLDPKGVIVGLSPKGHKAKKDTSGFVIRNYANHNA